MIKIYLSNVLGAPSPTAVIISDTDVEYIEWRKIAGYAYSVITKNNINFSKMAIISEECKNSYKFKFIQIKKREGKVLFESNANCGNSMIASARVIYNIKPQEDKSKILLINVDTKLEFLIEKSNDNYNIEVTSLKGKIIDSFEMYKNESRSQIGFENETIEVSMLNAVNEYIIVNAQSIGIESEDLLLSLDENDSIYLPRVKNIRNRCIEKYNLDKQSEFPKIAVVFNNGQLAARTIYLDNWHKGLPITAAITIMIASKLKDSVIYNKDANRDKILTPKEEKNICLKLNAINEIEVCKIKNVKSIGEIEEIRE